MLKGGTLRGYPHLMPEELVAYARHWAEEGEIDLPQVTNELTERRALPLSGDL